MNKNIILSEKFRNSMKCIQGEKYYIQKDFQNLVLSKIENLTLFPKMYPRLENKRYRKIPMKNYIIIYTIEKSIVKILDIIPTKAKKSNDIHRLKSKFFNNQD